MMHKSKGGPEFGQYRQYDTKTCAQGTTTSLCSMNSIIAPL